MKSKMKKSINRVVLFALLIAMGASTLPSAQAHIVPAGCTENGLTFSLAVFREDGTTPIGGDDLVREGEVIKYQTSMSFGGGSNCAFEGGKITIDPPGSTGPTDVTPAGGIPLCGTGCSNINSQQLSYTVKQADVDPDNRIRATAHYEDISHSNSDDTEKASDTRTTSNKVAVSSSFLTKTASASEVNVGEKVIYTYREKNDGNVPLKDVRVEDDKCSPVNPSLKANGKNVGDTNDNGILDPDETWVYTCETVYNTPGEVTNIAIAHGIDPFGADITYPLDKEERATVTITVKKTECKDRCKVVGWGTLGPKAAPELTFKIFAYTGFLPKGTVEVEDKDGNKIVATEISSVKTDKSANPMTGEIRGKATFNGVGSYSFVVEVKDGGEPTYAPYVSNDWFKISIPTKPYTKEGKLTSGDLQVIY